MVSSLKDQILGKGQASHNRKPASLCTCFLAQGSDVHDSPGSDTCCSTKPFCVVSFRPKTTNQTNKQNYNNYEKTKQNKPPNLRLRLVKSRGAFLLQFLFYKALRGTMLMERNSHILGWYVGTTFTVLLQFFKWS